MDVTQKILQFWFGSGQASELPSKARTDLWFGHADPVAEQMRERFEEDLNTLHKAESVDKNIQDPRGRLAVILLLDQFPRKMYYQSPKAYQFDTISLQVCLEGMKLKQDHDMTLIERVFFYMPLQHAEDITVQQHSVQTYENLKQLCLLETIELFQAFLAIAVQRCEIIEQFGRFPTRNAILNRESTPKELIFLKNEGTQV